MEEANAVKTLASVMKQLTLHEEMLQKIKSDVSAIKIDSQYYIKSTKEIIPGSKCKITYDTDGLVSSGGDLLKTDIPLLDITQIDGLYDSLAGKATKSDTERINQKIDELFTDRGVPYGMGTKVIYDANGLITESQDLSADDIPSLPVSKIEGLEEMISSLDTPVTVEEFVHPSISPSTSVKVTYDANGHIIQSGELGMNDLPRELVNQLNEIQSTLVNMAPKRIVDSLSKQVSELSSQMETYTKVVPESKVQSVISIGDVEGLDQKLKDFVKYEDIVELQSELSTVTELVASKKPSPMETSSMGTWSGKITEIKQDVAELDKKVSYVYDAIPLDRVMKEMENLEFAIRDLKDKIMNIEKHIGGTGDG